MAADLTTKRNKARVARARARLRLVQLRLQETSARYVDRAAATAQADAEAATFFKLFDAAPGVYAATFAEALSLDRRKARALLARFVRLARAELGDIKR